MFASFVVKMEILILCFLKGFQYEQSYNMVGLCHLVFPAASVVGDNSVKFNARCIDFFPMRLILEFYRVLRTTYGYK